MTLALIGRMVSAALVGFVATVVLVVWSVVEVVGGSWPLRMMAGAVAVGALSLR